MADQNKMKSGGFNPVGLCIGMSIGLCLGVAMDNIALGMCLGTSIGVCFSVALGRRADDGDKKDETSEEDKE